MKNNVWKIILFEMNCVSDSVSHAIGTHKPSHLLPTNENTICGKGLTVAIQLK